MVDDGESDAGNRASSRALPGAPTLAAEKTQPGGTATPTQDTVVPVSQGGAPVELPAPGYQLGELIGKGGMGEVVAAHDQRIGREIAIKRMRAAVPDAEQITRFLREARIQARLDHPAIVPVYELGTDLAGRPYFTMKRVSGRTLGQRMADGAPLQALLRALIDVCLAVDLAHSRGVVHRDLKPANIMLGDFGEVYVLDWGVARVVTDETTDGPKDIGTLDDGTQTGALLGTPGYMSPEQIKGQPALPPADVYALGAILFEILTGESLHPRGTAAIASTLSNPQVAPTRRRSDKQIPPELDHICHVALAEEPAERPTARGLADQVQAYLDGDRDVERRRRMARELLATAIASRDDGTAKGRATAIHSAGRALALDPDSTEASELVMSLIVDPPAVLPPELAEDLANEERKLTKKRSKGGVAAYLSLWGFFLIYPFMGVKSWPWLLSLYGVVSLLTVITWRSSRTGRFNVYVGMAVNLALVVMWTRIAGPFITTPVLICGAILGMSTSSVLIKRNWMVVAWAAVAFLLPVSLEYLGVLERTWGLTTTSIDTKSILFSMAGPGADALFVVGHIMIVGLVGLFSVRTHGAAKDAKRRLHIQAWHLNHLLPSIPRPWSTRPTRAT